MAIHPTAIVDQSAEIDPSAEIGPYVVIDGPVRVGPDVRVHAHACLCAWTRIGAGCEVHTGAVIGQVPQDRAFGGERSYCEIGERTVVREHATVHRGTDPESRTIVGADCLLAAGSHVAHNCVLGNHVNLLNGVLLGGHVHIGDRAFISGLSGVHQFCRVGELVMMSGGGRFSCDVPPFLLAVGRNQVVGINRVGLIRAEVPRTDIEEVREAYRRLYRSREPMSRSIAQLDAALVTPTGRRMVEFLLADRRRPLVRPRSIRARAVTSEE